MPDNMVSGIVTFTTDFGLADGYVGTMKGALLKAAPSARIVDISHNVEPFDLVAGYLILKSAYRYFSKGTVHVQVVDPGVGSNRRHVLVQAAGYYFIGPDNGILGSIAALNQGKTFELNPEKVNPDFVSNTFHGRDVYAPAAGLLIAQNGDHSTFSFPVSNLVKLDIPRPRTINSELQGEIIHCDRFGNLITNITPQHLPDEPRFFIGDRRLSVGSHYSQLIDNQPGVILNSWGYFEIALNRQSAAQMLGMSKGNKITVRSEKD